MIVLETSRLTLRHLEPGDLPALASIQADPEVMRYFPSGPRTPRESRAATSTAASPSRPSGGSASGRRSTAPTAA